MKVFQLVNLLRQYPQEVDAFVADDPTDESRLKKILTAGCHMNGKQFLSYVRILFAPGHNEPKKVEEKPNNLFNWVHVAQKHPKEGEQVITACRNKNKEDGIWLYDLAYYFSDDGWEGRENWEDVVYWSYINEPEEK